MPTSGSGRKKRKRKNSSNKGDRKSQLKFTPPVSPEPIEGVLFKSSEATEEKKQRNVEDSEHNREDRESVLVDDCVLQKQETVSNISKNLPWGQTKPLGLIFTCVCLCVCVSLFVYMCGIMYMYMYMYVHTVLTRVIYVYVYVHVHVCTYSTHKGHI